MSPGIHLYQSLSDLRTGPLQSASGKRHREAVVAQCPNRVHHIATDAGGKTTISAGHFMDPEYRLASNTSSIERRAIPTRAT